MKFREYVDRLIASNRVLHPWLTLVFALFFLVPASGFIFFGIRYNIITDRYFPFFLLFFLIFSLIGLVMLRRRFDRIAAISRKISDEVVSKLPINQPRRGPDEISNIMDTFSTLESRFGVTFGQLQKKISELSTLKELADLCYVSSDPEEILYATLERALKLAGADLGSVLILERPHRKAFVVKAVIGLGEQYLKLGDRIDFADSIAKYAVINKSPLIVEDIEKDTRFGRENRQQYGTRSFVCMPIKTRTDIVGVVTLSKKDDAPPFTSENVEVLSPLLGNAAFSYENIQLFDDRREKDSHVDAMMGVIEIINSGLRESELLHAILQKMQSVVFFDDAMILTKDTIRTNDLKLLYRMETGGAHLLKDVYHPYGGSVFDKVLKQGTTFVVEDVSALVHESETALLAGKRACALVPLKIEKVSTGIMVLSSEASDVFYRLLELIDRMADALSLAMERNRLTDYVIRRNQELNTLKQIGNALASSTFDINHVLKYTIDMISTVMNVEAGALLLMREGSLEFIVTLNLDMERLRGIRIPLGQGVAGYVATRGSAVIANDIGKSPLFSPDVDSATGFHTKDVLCVPMISEGRVTGVIEVLNKKDGEFDASDKELLQSIASSVIVAIENANHYNETLSMAEHERSIRHMFQKFVPKEIVDRIVHGSDTGQLTIDEFRVLTLINIDIRGFSLLSQKIEPQKTVLLLNRFFSVMGEIIIKNHGIVDKYLGDGFLAIFGAPVSHTGDADNAVTAAVEMRDAITRINQYWVKEAGDPVTIGISVHTGKSVVGNIGFDKKMDYTAIGDSVNAVFRLQTLTKSFPNGIIISETTLRAVQARLNVREIDTDGVASIGDLKAYELIGIETSG